MKVRTTAFRVAGMDCAEEVAILKRELGGLVGGEGNLGFDLLAGKLTVAGEVDAEVVRRRIAATGMRAEPWLAGARAGADGARRRGAWLAALSGAAMAAGFAAHATLAGGVLAALGAGELAASAVALPLPARLLYLVAVVAGGWLVAPKAWAALRRARPDMHLLMTIAVAGALGIGEWLEAATVAFLFALSLALEGWSVGRARRAVEALLELAPPLVRVRRPDGSLAELPAAEAAVRSRFVVRPGERLALDGVVVAGVSEVDQSPLTGESLPVAKQPGDEVFAGSINGRGALEVESTRAASETTLARILRSVEEARSRRSPSERWVERFARIYTPLVFALALVVGLGWPLAGLASWGDGIYRGLALLVIGCPCALVVATPVSVVASLAAAARHGVLIKGGRYVEEPARVVTVAMDKTGTLTRGRPAVTGIVPLSGHDEDGLVARAAALEAHSEHALAHAIRDEATRRGLAAAAAEGFAILPGRGAEGSIGGRRFWIGSHRMLEERGQETPEIHARIEALAAGGATIVVVGNETHVCGLIALADEIRPEARRLVGELHAAGVRRVVMLTGDHRPTAERVAAVCGIDEVQAELLPAEKLEAIERLVARDRHVAMVGDGVNDAPALARATVGVAMGAAGTDAAIETADVALLSDDLSRLPWLIRHSRRTLATIRANAAFALAIKAVFVAFALGGMATLWGAIAADMGATLLVIANALRLLRS